MPVVVLPSNQGTSTRAMPNFLIIGAMKAGTTSLYNHMRQHPEIYMPSTKEPDFFTRAGATARELRRYRSHFKATANAKAVGEASVNYSKFPHYQGVPERIAAARKDMRLIYIIRNPFKRIYSHYLHNVYAGIEGEPLGKALSERPLYVQTSLYFMQITQYLSFFSKDQILTILLDDLHDHPFETVRKIFDFLKVDPGFRPSNLGEVMHETRLKWGRDRVVTRRLRGIPILKRIHTALPDLLRTPTERLLKKKIAMPDQKSMEFPPHLKELIASDLESLSNYLGRDLGFWLAP